MRRLPQPFLRILALLLCGLVFQPASASAQRKVTLTTKSERARALFLRGLDKHDRVRMKETAVLFRQALEADPEFATARLFRGMAGDSVPDIRQAAELSGNLPEAERLFILIYQAQYDSELPKAVEHAEQAVKLLPAELRLRVRLAQLYSAATQPDDAGAGRKTPLDMRNYHYLLGDIFLEEEDFAGARENLRQANTDDVFIKLLMARAGNGLGERASAEKLCWKSRATPSAQSPLR